MEETEIVGEYRQAYPEEIVKNAIFYLRDLKNSTLPYVVNNNRYRVLGISRESPNLITLTNIASVKGNPIGVSRDRLLKSYSVKDRIVKVNITIDINF